MATMIALIGEQQLPNFLPMRHYSPSDVLLVYTEKTQQQYENLKAVLEQKKVKVYGIETDPYDISAIVRAINEELAHNKELAQAIEASSQPPMFNLTGGTKTMSLAAYQVAAQRSAPVIYLQSERKQSLIDLYGWRNHHLYHQSRKELPGYLDLDEVLNLHLGQGRYTKDADIRKEDPKSRKGGYLFELAIGQALQDHGYEVLCGVKDSNRQIDTDVMIRYQNHIGIIEAKTKTGKKDYTFKGIQQLSTGMRYFGATYTRPFLVTNYELTNDQKKVCELLRIHSIISLLQYQQDMVTLPQADTNTLLTAIDKIMKPENKAEK